MQDTMVNGLSAQRSDKVKVDRSGQMAPCTKVGGKITKPTVLVDSFMLMVMFMMVNG